MGSMKQINIKNRTYCSFGVMVNIKYFDSYLLKIDKNLLHWKHHNERLLRFQNCSNYSDFVNIHSVNPSYFIIGEIDGYIQEKHENKYLIFAFTDENKEALTKYTELWNRTKDLIQKINNKPGKYGKDVMKT